jgi:hypothetical protein
MLRGLRLVGLARDENWPATPEGDPAEAGADWVRDRLSGTRSSAVTLLCLDVDGGVCSWLTSPSANPAVVAALARQGAGLSDSARVGESPLDFYAADSFSSSIQPLEPPSANGTMLKLRPQRKAQPQDPHRMAVLGLTDVPARLLMDALDREGIPVESVASLWHVMAAAWDPSAPRTAAEQDPLEGQTASLTGVILADPQSSRLVWSWSRAGRLVVAGSMRLRTAAAETTALANPGDSAPMTVAYGAEEVSRLATEWLTWAAQLGQAPSRFVCILPDGEQAGGFGRAMGKAWPGASVDVVTSEDPVGATLKRAAGLLENSPVATDHPDPRAGLLDLSRRPGAQHRRMYVWWSGAIAAAAVVLGVLGFQLRSGAEKARAAAGEWRTQGLAVITQVAPDIKVAPGKSQYQTFKDQVQKAANEIKEPDRTEYAMPVMEELETISLVLGNNGYAIESVDLSTTGLPRFSVIVDKTKDAEDLLAALGRVSGSHVVDWNLNVKNKKEGDQDKIQASFSGQWVHAKQGGQR